MGLGIWHWVEMWGEGELGGSEGDDEFCEFINLDF